MIFVLEAIPLIFFLVIVWIVLVNTFGLFRGFGRWNKAFEEVSTRYGGWYSAARGTRKPSASFSYKNAEVRVKCRRSSGPRGTPQTEFRIKWPDKSYKMEIVGHGQRRKMRAFKNTERTPTGEAEFDSQFEVYFGPYGKAVSQLLMSSGVRWQIKQLQLFLDHVPAHILIDRGWLIVRQPGFIKETQQLDDFVRFCLELYDQMNLTLSEGIEFRDDHVIAAVEDVRCPVCGGDVEGTMVMCVRCKTPHCQDCWEYNGKCGMYACDEKRFLRVGG